MALKEGPVKFCIELFCMVSHFCGMFKTEPALAAVQPDLTMKAKEIIMLRYSVIFFVIAIIAAALGFGGIAGSAAGIAKILFIAFLVLAVLSLLFGRRL